MATSPRGRWVYDLVIAGAGPAGCLAAIGALQREPRLSVLVVDEQLGARHAVGEALLTGTVMTLDEAGVLERVRGQPYLRKRGAAYRWGPQQQPWYVDYRAADASDYPTSMVETPWRYSFHVPRWHFDALLRGAAEDHGAVFGQARVRFRTNAGAPPAVTGARLDDGTDVRGRYFIDATGQASALGRTAERRRIAAPKTVRYAYTRSIDWARAEAHGFARDRTNIMATGVGWMWVINFGAGFDDLASVGFVAPAGQLRGLSGDDLTRHFPRAGDFGIASMRPLDEHGAAINRWYRCGDYAYRGHRLSGPNWAQAGDAALFVDPILSTGVTLASHYGLLRGRQAAAWLAGGEHRQHELSEHYLREGLVVHEVCQHWYSAEQSGPTVWKDEARALVRSGWDYDLSGDEAFRWLTNLEWLREAYHPFGARQRRHVEAALDGRL